VTSLRHPRLLSVDALVRRLLWLVPVGVAGNLVYTLLATDRQALQASLDVDWRWLLLAALLAVVPLALQMLRVWRWGRVLQPGFRRRDAVQTILLAEVGAAVTPSALGGTPLKIAALTRHGLGPTGAVTVAALGGLEDTVVLATLVPLTAAATGQLPRLGATVQRVIERSWPWRDAYVWVVLAVAVLLALLVVLALGTGGHRRRARVRAWLRDQAAVLRLVRRYGPRTFVGNLLVTAVQWWARLSIVTVVVAGLGVTLDPLRAAVLQWLCFVGMAITPTPGAIGGAEAMFVVVFGQELPGSLIPLATSAWRLVTFYGLNTLALVLLLGPFRDRLDDPST
jgi:uncharacterized protein (TIRG00374 family)